MSKSKNTPLNALKHHVSGAIERGEAKAIEAIPVTKHTPGPWEIADEAELDNISPNDSPFGIWAYGRSADGDIDGNEKRIGEVDVYWTTPEEVKGNAYLIAAAPEMLKLLKNMETAIGTEALPMINEDGETSGFADEIRSVIAKAEGRS